jgi:Zn ribbon nucleic-acid-binding protein
VARGAQLAACERGRKLVVNVEESRDLVKQVKMYIHQRQYPLASRYQRRAREQRVGRRKRPFDVSSEAKCAVLDQPAG